MFVSIRHYTTTAPAEVTRIVNQEFVPKIAGAPGFVAYYGVEAGPDEWTSVSIFDTREQADASNQLAAEWVKSNVSPLVSGPPTVFAGKLVVKKEK